ncbi:MAG: hypothetical protein Q3972_03110 [Corynebacterium sp.]|nr:hypothetical protein [Corynebacterium sp.]
MKAVNRKYMSLTCAALLAFSGITTPLAIADETQTESTTQTESEDNVKFRDGSGEKRPNVLSTDAVWNFGSSALVSSYSKDNLVYFTQDSWLLKAALKIFTSTPFSLIFKDKAKTEQVLRGLFGSYWSDDQRKLVCDTENYKGWTPVPSDEELAELRKRCDLGYSAHFIERFQLLWRTVTSS